MTPNRSLAATLLLALTPGCGTFFGTAEWGHPYAGVRADYEVAKLGVGYATVALADLPFSVAADTLILPVTGTNALGTALGVKAGS